MRFNSGALGMKYGFLLAVGVLTAGVCGAQDGGGETVPESILRPQFGEAVRYPQDTVIGELGAGDAPAEAFAFARNFLQGLLSQNREAQVFADTDPDFLDELFGHLKPIDPRRFRLGGGREEPDGSVSFLVRFIGRESWIAGELYLQPEENTWKLDDMVLEEPRDAAKGGQTYRFDFSPYERFF
ncbi:MAG: hypothetical protein LBG87_01710 [Spirochaetaceae bacterium]|jgi:hypothetical protein|nr:hypothetical protein [Spirochaetaceae bacterium]